MQTLIIYELSSSIRGIYFMKKRQISKKKMTKAGKFREKNCYLTAIHYRVENFNFHRLLLNLSFF